MLVTQAEVIEVEGGSSITGGTPPSIQEALDDLGEKLDALMLRIRGKKMFATYHFLEGSTEDRVLCPPVAAQISSYALLVRELTKTL